MNDPKKLKNKSKTLTEGEFRHLDGELQVEVGKITENSSRKSSFSSMCSDNSVEGLAKKKRKCEETDYDVFLSNENRNKEVLQLRKDMETFLFNDSSKISKTAIQYIMSKWSELESKLYFAENENNKLRGKLEEQNKYIKNNIFSQQKLPAPDYATIASKRPMVNKNPSRPESNPIVLLIKPRKDTEMRNNDEIKQNLINMLKPEVNKIKIRNLRKMKRKGLVLELEGEKDVEVLKRVDLSKIDLKIEAPRKQGPCIIIYDIDKNVNKYELLDQLWSKNLNDLEINKQQFDSLVIPRFNIKTKNPEKLNWVIEVSANIYKKK